MPAERLYKVLKSVTGAEVGDLVPGSRFADLSRLERKGVVAPTDEYVDQDGPMMPTQEGDPVEALQRVAGQLEDLRDALAAAHRESEELRKASDPELFSESRAMREEITKLRTRCERAEQENVRLRQGETKAHHPDDDKAEAEGVPTLTPGEGREPVNLAAETSSHVVAKELDGSPALSREPAPAVPKTEDGEPAKPTPAPVQPTPEPVQGKAAAESLKPGQKPSAAPSVPPKRGGK